MSAKKPLFREHALQQYLRKKEQDILPRAIKPPFFITAWLLASGCLLTLLLAWRIEVPIFANGPGIVQAQNASTVGNPTQNGTRLIVFLPASYAPQLHAGVPAQIYIGKEQTHISGRVLRIEPGVLSPIELQTRYALFPKEAQEITQPDIVLTLKADQPLAAQKYAGSQFNARIQVGSQNILSLLPVIKKLMGS